jgi:hypothetical protein
MRPLYFQFLGRDADTAGLTGWLAQMKQGMTRESLRGNFARSLEYFNQKSSCPKNVIAALSA